MHDNAEFDVHRHKAEGEINEKEPAPYEIFQHLLTQARQAGDVESRDRLAQTFQTFIRRELNYSPNIFNDLSLQEQLSVALEFSRIPEAQGSISQILVGELVYELANVRNLDRFLEDWLSHLSVEQQLDAINYLTTINADAVAQDRTRRIHVALSSIAGRIAENEDANPFLRYAAKSALPILTAERNDPSRDVVIQFGDRTVGRRRDRTPQHVMEEHERLQRILRSADDMQTGDTMQRIARDAVASMDHAHTLQSVTFFTKEQERTAIVDINAPAPRTVKKVLKLLALPAKTPPALRKQLDLSHAHLRPTNEDPGTFWHHFTPEIPATAWASYWHARHAFDAIEQEAVEYAAAQQRNAEDQNAAASHELVLAAQNAITATNHSNLKRFASDLWNPDPEVRFHAALELAQLSEYHPDLPKAIKNLAQLANNVRRRHEEYFQLAQHRIHAFDATLDQRAEPLRETILPFEQNALTPDLLAQVRAYGTQLQAASTAITTTFYPLSELNDRIPTAASPHINVAHLLAELHRPEMRAQIEHDMGIALVDLSLREQGQLLTFLAQSSSKEVARTFAVIQRLGIPAARMFLAGEYVPDIHASLVTLAETMEHRAAVRLLDAYCTTIDHATQLGSRITASDTWQHANLPNDIKTTFGMRLQQAFEKRAKDIFIALNQEMTFIRPEDVQVAFEGITVLVDILQSITPARCSILESTPERNVLLVRHHAETYRLAITARDRHVATKDTGAKGGGEARLAFELFFDDSTPHFQRVFHHTITRSKRKPQQRSSLRLSLDRDVWDPENPRISLDVGRGTYHDSTMSVQGDILGTLMDSIGDEGHHDRTTFPAEWASEASFSLLIRALNEYLQTALHALPQVDQHPTAKVPQKSVA